MADYTTVLAKLQEKKERSLALAASFYRLGYDDRAKLLLDCGTFLGFADLDGGGCALVEANFCKQRLCPACNWRRSLKIFAATSQILDWCDEHHACKYLFLTLTVRNVPLSKLGETIDDMAAAYHRLTCNKAWRRRVLGCMRTLEVTINPHDLTAHPHYHLILAVAKSYATKADATYWDHDRWVAAWRKAARLDYTPNVWIERVRGRRSGIAEVSKYMAKDTDYLVGDPALTDQIVGALQQHLHRRRLVSYTGIMLEAQRALRLDPEEGALTDTVRGDVVSAIRHYRWVAGLSQYRPWRSET